MSKESASCQPLNSGTRTVYNKASGIRNLLSKSSKRSRDTKKGWNEDQFKSSTYKQKNQVISYAQKKGITVIEICAKTELEISKLDEEDMILFKEDMGIKETGIEKLANAVYDFLGLISFLTVGEDEVRAWPIRKGISAKAAGGKIHFDIERGFIRAEVVKYNDILNLGTMAKVKENGLFRLEGKEYVTEVGDIINFRFNV